MDDAIKGTDFDGLDLLPADFTYRNMDLLLGGADAKNEQGKSISTGRKPRRIAWLARPAGATDYDVVFLDCPPSISLVSENILHAVDTLLVPIIPTTLSERTFDQITGFIARSSTGTGRTCWRSSPWSTGASGCAGKSFKHFLQNGPLWLAPQSPHYP